MDPSHDMTPASGPWAGGWLVAALAGLFAAWVARMIGDVGTLPAALVSGMTFLVFGALLGSGGVELTDSAGADHAPAPEHH